MLFYSLDLKPSFFSIRPYFGVKKEGFLELLSVFSEKNAVFYTKIAFFSLKCLQVPKVCVPLQPQSRNIDCEHKNAGAIAQLVEQRTENPCVPGSIPGGTTKNHSKKMKTSEFQRIQRFSFCFNCAKHADLGISIVPNSWLFFEPLKKATI